jgi:DNA-binding MarR family transcriptional regulator
VTAQDPLPPTLPAGLDEGPLGDLLGYRLAQATVVTDQAFSASAGARCDLRKVEFTVLALVEQNGGLTAAQLAAALAFTPPNMTAWLDRLGQRGLVERRPHPRDKRAMQLHATPAGSTLLREAVAQIAHSEAQAFARLTAAERGMLLELLQKAAGCRQVGEKGR